jgi:hypothetical protein
MRSTDGIGDPLIEVGGALGALALREVEEELTISLRSGQP